ADAPAHARKNVAGAVGVNSEPALEVGNRASLLQDQYILLIRTGSPSAERELPPAAEEVLRVDFQFDVAPGGAGPAMGKNCHKTSVAAERWRSPAAGRLMHRRHELLERPALDLYETGGTRRTHLRGHDNILKRFCARGRLQPGRLAVGMTRLLGFGSTPSPFDSAAETVVGS